MNKKDFLRKISSRKFWAMVAGFVSSILVIFNVGDNQIAQITAIITAFGSIAVYMLAEGSADVAQISSSTTSTTITEQKSTQTNLTKDLNKVSSEEVE